LSPEEKAERVRSLDDHDTLMVGDGLNDSPSFEAALCAATPAVDRPVLPGKADFFFLGDGIAAIGRALAAAHHLRRIVKQNLMIAVLYNVIAVALCLAGLVTPVVAAILMPLSSISVVSLTALRLAKGADSWT
jgi:Cu2+-exporting ATPase